MPGSTVAIPQTAKDAARVLRAIAGLLELEPG